MKTGDAIQQVMERLIIDDVGHQNSTFSIADDFRPDVNEEQAFRIQLRTLYSDCIVDDLFDIDDGKLHRYRFFYDLGIRILDNIDSDDENDETKIISVIEARMYSQYVEVRGNDTVEIDMEILQEFGKANGLYHVWPYWREYVQSVVVRLKLPAITIPMFRLPKENWKQEANGDAS